MSLLENLSTTLSYSAESVAHFSELIDIQWIEASLTKTGKASIRKRKLPAEQVVWLVIGLALFRNQPIWYVVQQLDLVQGESNYCYPSATVQARQRLGQEPLAELFRTLSQSWLEESLVKQEKYQDLQVFAVDGVIWTMPHTPDNFSHFGSSKGKTASATWPQARAVCLMNTQSHELIDAQLGDMSQGELTLAHRLSVPHDSITLFDRAYFSADFLMSWQEKAENSHWLMRAKDNLRYEVIEKYGQGDYLIQMPVSARAQKLNPTLGQTWQARLMEVEHEGKKRRYITSLINKEKYSKKTLVTLYIQRWEIELGFREIKSSLQEGMMLRSKLPELVYQEIWGVLIAYNLIRRQMKIMANTLEVSPLRMSFHVCSLAIINLLRFAPLLSAGTLPKQLQSLMNQASMFVLPKKRERAYPRVVKPKPQKYPIKKCQLDLN